ncbi:MAG: DoxX family protein [Gemmatimonadota bacterium]|nr:DoxX family protein [Gemmatimonadota bacterium]
MNSTTTRHDLGMLALRLTTGAVFVAHGAQKLFVYGFGGVSGAFGGMNIPAPTITGPLTALVEFFGGLALVFGLLTRLTGLGLGITMLGAIAFVHIANGFFAPNGVEYPLALLGANVALMCIGAGRFSLDALIASRRGRVS